MQAMRLTAAGHSQTGKRTQNEDNFCLQPDLQPDLAIFVVADGMGGLQAGEEASKLAVDLIPNLIVERIQAKAYLFKVKIKWICEVKDDRVPKKTTIFYENGLKDYLKNLVDLDDNDMFCGEFSFLNTHKIE